MLSEALGGRHRRHPHRQERRVRLRLLEARRHVRPRDARCGAPAVQQLREPRRAPSCSETVTAIDPEARRVTTDAGVHEADVLVVALGADYDIAGTPGLAECGQRVLLASPAPSGWRVLPAFASGRVVIGVCGAPFKCPPAPSECALLLHDDLMTRGIRDDCEISFVMPFGTPVPPSPDTSAALLAVFAERGIRSCPAAASPRSTRQRLLLDDGSALPFDLFLGVPKHRAPDVVLASRLPRTATSRSRRPRRRGSPACTRSATSRPPACRRRACSPKELHVWSRRHCARSPPAATRPAARRAGLLLHRVRVGPRRPHRHRLPLRPEPHRGVPGPLA